MAPQPQERSLASIEKKPMTDTMPIYATPNHGILSLLPKAWVPYAELMRLDRPAGLYAFYVPYLIGLAYGANLASPPPSPSHLAGLGLLFLLGCVILRGAACAWNDNIDQDFDRKVARCRLRPIARGAVSTTQGHLFTLALTVAGMPLFAFLPAECAWHAVPITILFGFYPFAKRLTYYPQVVLGFPFAWSIAMCCAALGVDPFGPENLVPTVCLGVANILWTVIYDTIYAHQDIRDDIKAGVKSMAVRFANTTKLLTSVLTIIQIGLMVVTGYLAKFGPAYFLGTCGATAVAMTSMIVLVDLKRPASCAWWFHNGFWFVGGTTVLGMLGDYLMKREQWEMSGFDSMLSKLALAN